MEATWRPADAIRQKVSGIKTAVVDRLWSRSRLDLLNTPQKLQQVFFDQDGQPLEQWRPAFAVLENFLTTHLNIVPKPQTSLTFKYLVDPHDRQNVTDALRAQWAADATDVVPQNQEDKEIILKLLQITEPASNAIAAQQIVNLTLGPNDIHCAREVWSQNVWRTQAEVAINDNSSRKDRLNFLYTQSIPVEKLEKAIDLFSQVWTEIRYDNTTYSQATCDVLFVHTTSKRRKFPSIALMDTRPRVVVDLNGSNFAYAVGHEAIHAVFGHTGGFPYSHMLAEGYATRLAEEFVENKEDFAHTTSGMRLAAKTEAGRLAYSHTGVLLRRGDEQINQEMSMSLKINLVEGAYVYGYFLIDALLDDEKYKELVAIAADQGRGKYAVLLDINKHSAAIGKKMIEKDGNPNFIPRNSDVVRAVLDRLGFSKEGVDRIVLEAEKRLREKAK